MKFELTAQTREPVDTWIAEAHLVATRYLFPSRLTHSPQISPRQYAWIVKSWIRRIGLDPKDLSRAVFAHYLKLQQALAENPEAGPVIPGSGGVRKLRWPIPGRGKRGGLRVIYYLRSRKGLIWMLTLYPKNVAENIPAHVLRQIRQEIEYD
ncbi:MAG: hypothetical protein ACHBNF_06805 [Chromatiales bacterium]